jgi:hypothetical protein
MSSGDVPAQRGPRVEVPCDKDHLDQLRAPSSDVAVPTNAAALESVASLLAHTRTRPAA